MVPGVCLTGFGMDLRGLITALLGDDGFARVRDAARKGIANVEVGVPRPLRAFITALIAADAPYGAGRPVLAVTATEREATELATALEPLLPAGAVAEYPAWETLPHERLSPRADTVGRRVAVRRLLREQGGTLRVITTPVRALLQPQVAGLGDLEPVELRPGDEADLNDVVARLVAIGYHRVDLVERRGEIAVRGGILDIFPPTAEHPLRVEFFGDRIEEIRPFRAGDQRSFGESADRVWATACRELLLTDRVVTRAAELAQRYPQLADILGKVAHGVVVEGMEALAPLLADEMNLLLDEVPSQTVVVVCDPERVRARAADVVRTGEEFLHAAWAGAAAGGNAPIDLAAAALRPFADIRRHAADLGLAWWSISPLQTADAAEFRDDTGEVVIVPDAHEAPAYRGDTQALVADVKGWLGDGLRVAVLTAGHGSAQRIVEVLAGEDVPARWTETIPQPPDHDLVSVSCGGLDAGFIARGAGLVVLTETEIFGTRAAARNLGRLPSRRRKSIDPLELRPGDFVVHEQHGVGRFVGMATREIGGATREYLVIEYAPSRRGQPGDRLWVPTDSLDQVTRYVGGEAPTLDRIGGADWARRKGRARKAVREIAAELIQLYSARMASPGHAFGPDTPWQRELEEAFPYVETPDQLRTIEEVKADMERPVPMDRLICGDVGYGKTEIAVRAAFKAVQDGKQVAVLCPTTLLVQQHYATFSERFANFPVVVKPVSRFNTFKEQEEILAGLAAGTVDVVIGTHRLLSDGVVFKDLGLVIVDEEQRFGVEHKERLKRLRTNVDVLTMSATPIPRTLEMAITGIREMSVIQTPPEERHPVLTFVGPFDEHQIAAAIRRELLREGQVFYVHNRVETIEQAAARVRELVPEARVAVAHGQMNEDALEQVMIGFWERAFDVLVCTTIIESGLDIPNANTLIVERADLLGLGQLYQLRGRVGRGRERGYAYFCYPADRPLTETAHDRLATIAQHSDLGSGMSIAMKDLEIRGAGNLLGGEQSGHIAEVGFDLYMRLVGEAVADFRGDQSREPVDVRLDLPVEAHIPHDYIDAERLRLATYQALAEATSDPDVDAIAEELLDRYGPLPEPVRNLLEVAKLRGTLRAHGVTEVALQGTYIRLAPVQLRDSQKVRLQRLYPKSIVKDAVQAILVPRPRAQDGRGDLLRDAPLVLWVRDLVQTVLDAPISAAR
ncbi:transcription-repair coupling factor [Acidothermus cellulolyticus 11B]|uniref:Transcription-repair-coupling factor n=2 Tax=Acidothermus cellulolyticus TaxID=28049 RepID=A0LW75_ACIC1|nr:transcription-repair coupling factor [Acidothermus cellulolyticus 11B]